MTRDHDRTATCTRMACAVVVLLTACSSGPGSTTERSTSHGGSASHASVPPSAGPRIESTAEVRIAAPKSGASVPAAGAPLVVALSRAELTGATTQDITPDEGHLHVTVDGALISMTAGLRQTLPDLEPGRHVIRVEFVATDHLPFDPRVVTQAVVEVG